eukprot:gene4604-9149_t
MIVIAIHLKMLIMKLLLPYLFLTKSVESLFTPKFGRVRMISMSATDIPAISKNFALVYSYAPDILEKRTPYRPAHLALWEDLLKKGVLVAGGAFNPPEGGMFIVKASSKADIEEYVKMDPYKDAGLITDVKIMEWNVVIGTI